MAGQMLRLGGGRGTRTHRGRGTGARVTHVVDGHDDAEVELLAHAGVDDRDRPGPDHLAVVDAVATEEVGDLLERTLRGGQADALWWRVADSLEPFEGDRQVRAALGRRHRVDLVDDHDLDAGEGLRAADVSIR